MDTCLHSFEGLFLIFINYNTENGIWFADWTFVMLPQAHISTNTRFQRSDPQKMCNLILWVSNLPLPYTFILTSVEWRWIIKIKNCLFNATIIFITQKNSQRHPQQPLCQPFFRTIDLSKAVWVLSLTSAQ